MSGDIFACFKYFRSAAETNKNLVDKTMRVVISRNYDGSVS